MEYDALSLQVEQQKKLGRKSLGIEEVESMIAIAKAAHEKEVTITVAEISGNAHLAAEHLKAIIGFAQSAIKSALFINGGAVMMFVAFLGNNLSYFLENNFSITIYQSLWRALVSFGLGAFLASSSYAISYLSQSFYTEEFGKIAFQRGYTKQKVSTGDILRTTAIITCILAYAAMLVGMWFCASGLWVVNFLHK